MEFNIGAGNYVRYGRLIYNFIWEIVPWKWFCPLRIYL